MVASLFAEGEGSLECFDGLTDEGMHSRVMSVLRGGESHLVKMHAILAGSNSSSQCGIHRYDEGVGSSLYRSDVVHVTYSVTRFFVLGRS